MQGLNPEVLIDNLRKTDEYIESIFMNGGCFQFYKFLKSIYPDAKPYKVCCDPDKIYNHVITKIGNEYYDITGIVDYEDFYNCKEIDEYEISNFELWSFSKRMLLYKRCPHCQEEIYFTVSGKLKG